MGNVEPRDFIDLELEVADLSERIAKLEGVLWNMLSVSRQYIPAQEEVESDGEPAGAA